jgi:hypothetical protein
MVLGHGAPEAVRRRVTTFTYVRADRLLEPHDADRFAAYLARHYSSDYALRLADAGACCVRQFDTVGHMMFLEGACSIIAPTAAQPVLPEFLNRFKENTFRAHYVPLMLLALHEYAFLVERISQSLMTTVEEPSSETTLDLLANLRRDTLVFRLLYRFSQVSYITMHNAVNGALRKAFHLETMLNELGQDVSEGEAFFRIRHERLRAELEHERHRRYYVTSVLGAAALAGLTAFTIVKETYDSIHARQPGGLAGFLVGILIFVLACLVGYLKRPVHYASTMSTGEAEDEFTMHAALKNMLHVANRPQQ